MTAINILLLLATHLTSPVHNAAGPCPRALTNNDILEPEAHVIDTTYNHGITIRNGTEAPAIVKVSEQSTGDVIRFYVSKGSTAAIRVNDGTYEIAYAIGGKVVADCTTVVQPVHVAKFPKVEELRTTFEEGGYATAELELTLYRVRDGNVRTKSISVGDFNGD